MAMLRLDGCTPLTTRSLILISPLVIPSSPRDHVQKRGLAAARGANEDEELTLLHRDIDPVQHFDGAVGLGDVVDVEENPWFQSSGLPGAVQLPRAFGI